MASDAASTPLDEATASSVLRQVEFYFSDSNLPGDKFLRETVEQSGDGLVSLSLICSFSRMKSHLGLEATVKPDTVPEGTVIAVAEVLRRSPVLRVSEDGKRIGRASELLKPDEIIEQLNSRTVAASPFPYNVKLEDVQSFFTQYAKVNSVRLPPHIANKKHFCGTALVEFSEEGEAKNILEKSLVFAGAGLEVRPKKEFDAEQKSRKEGYEKVHPKKDRQDEGYPKGLIVAIKLKKTTADSVAQLNSIDKVSGSTTKLETANTMEKPSGEGSEQGVPESSDVKEMPGDVKDPISREDLKEALKKFGAVRFVDFSIGDDSGYVRFEDSKAAEKARVAAVLSDEGGFIVKDQIVTLEPVTGGTEKDYWNTIRGIQAKHMDNRSYKGRASKNYRGGKQFNGKRGRYPGSETNPNKAQKVQAVA